jgi:hypothetical protein
MICRFLLFTICLSFLFASCRSSKLDTVDTEARQYEIHPQHASFLTRPLIADLEVEQERKLIEYTGPLNLSMEDLKKNATAKFLKTHNCDYVADPVFEISKEIRNNFTREITIELSGFPVNYSNIYQVDTLPASIGQYSEINKEINRIRYYNSIEKEQVVWGVEALLGEYLRAQIDFPLGEDTRYYISFEKMDSPWSFTADIFEDRASDSYVGSGNGADYFTVSTGLFKEVPVAEYLKIRYGGGVNFTSYNLTGDFVANNQIKFSNIYNLGFRLKAGVDIPLYRNFSLIGQIHYNIDGLNIVFTDDPGVVPNADLSVEDIEINKTPDPPLYLGVGLRVIF